MGIQAGARVHFINAPAETVEAMRLPPVEQPEVLTGVFDYLHVFAKRQEELNAVFPELKAYLKPTGMLWVSWPKNRKLGTDITLPEVIRIGYSHGLVESKTISIDSTWSAIKFTHPKPGKIYKNSYGHLKV